MSGEGGGLPTAVRAPLSLLPAAGGRKTTGGQGIGRGARSLRQRRSQFSTAGVAAADLAPATPGMGGGGREAGEHTRKKEKREQSGLRKKKKGELLDLDRTTHIHCLIKPSIRHLNFSNAL